MSKPTIEEYRALVEKQDRRLTEVYAALDLAIDALAASDGWEHDKLAEKLRKIRTVRT